MNNSELKGISGWLVLVALGVVISPFRLYFSVLSVYPDIFSNGTWHMLTTENSTGYVSGFASVIILELAINLALFSGFIYLVFLFFTKRSTFPKAYIVLVILTLIYVPMNAFCAHLLFPEKLLFDKDTLTNLSTGIISALIWVPYMLKSRRVKNTFVVKHGSATVLKHSAIIFGCLVAFYTFYLISIKTEPEVVSVEQQLTKMADAVNRTLPKVLDKDTILDSVSASGYEFQYRYSFVDYEYAEIDADELNRSMRSDLVNVTCNTDATADFLNKGVVVMYSYFDKIGSLITSVNVKASDCT